MTDPEILAAPERILRFLLLCLLWAAWLAFRALWELLEWLCSERGRRALGRTLFTAALAAAIALLPKAGGFLWGWMMLRDAVEIQAMQSQGRDPREIVDALRHRAFALGFTDILDQEEAVRVERESSSEGDTCRIEVDFRHRLDLYGWTEVPLRIRLQVKKPVLPQSPEPDIKDLLR